MSNPYQRFCYLGSLTFGTKSSRVSFPVVAVVVMARGTQEKRSSLAQNDLRILGNRLLLSETRFEFMGGSGV